MKTKNFKRPIALFLAVMLCASLLFSLGTTAFAAEETANVCLIAFPRDGDANYNGEWGHGNLNFMNGWSTKASSFTLIRAMGQYSGNICYCIEPGVSQQPGDSLTKKGEDFWDNYPAAYNKTISPEDIKLLIGRIFQYGYTGPISVSWRSQNDGGDKLAHAVATQLMLHKMKHCEEYGDLDRTTKNSLRNGNQFTNRFDHTKALYIRHDGALCVGRQTRAVARADSDATTQYHKLISNLLKNEGIIRYRDAYSYARAAINDLPKEYTDLFSSRFQYVFIDEYQDCNNLQRQAIDAIFDSQKCAVFKIGDTDQAIYNSADDTTPDWIPQPDFLPIMTSCRFNQEIANVICKLKKGEKNIVTFAGETGVKPVLFVFSPEKIDRVIGGFISALERHELYDINGIYKAIGAIKKEDSAGLKIGSYWSEFDGSANKKNEYSYWGLVDEIVQYLLEGKLYKTEQSVRRLLCRVFHYISIKHPVSEKDYTMVTMKNALDEKYREQYRQWIYEMPRIQTIDRHSVDQLLRQKINELLRIGNPNLTDIFAVLPEFFLEEATGVNFADISEKNVLIDPIRGRRIVFDTIHGVKGETHDATLYLETNRQGATDLNRILPYFGVGRCGSSNLYDSSRKLAYVGMSRPKKLLCVAMQAATYEKSNGVFDTDWEVIDLRGYEEHQKGLKQAARARQGQKGRSFLLRRCAVSRSCARLLRPGLCRQ